MEGYSKDFDTVLLAYSVLKRLGSGDVDTFTQRLISQKTQYLAQVFGISPIYNFNLYVRGPYSPTLAQDLFKLKNDGIKTKEEAFIPQELEDRFIKAKSFIENKSPRQLELTSTLHWLEVEVNLPLRSALRKLKEIKSAAKEEIAETNGFVKKICRL